MKSYEEMTESVIRKSNVIIKQKERRKKAVINTSLAASLLAVMTTGIWVIRDNGSGSNTSFPVLQNPSEDTPLPPVTDISEDISVPEISTDETSGTEIDWDTIRLNAVYLENISDIFSTVKLKSGMLYGYYGPEVTKLDPNAVYAIEFTHTYVEGYDFKTAYREALNKLLEENKETIEEYERIIANYEPGWYQYQQEVYFPWLNALHEEARAIAAETAGAEEEGIAMLIADLDKIGIKVFTRTVTVYFTDDEGNLLYPEESYKPRTHRFVYATEADLIKLREYITGSDKYGIAVNLAPYYLREEGEEIYFKASEYPGVPIIF